jgi:hypothetical protein
MALGADAGRVQRMVLRQMGVMVAIDVTIGAVDPVVFVSAVLFLSAVAFGAGWRPRV